MTNIVVSLGQRQAAANRRRATARVDARKALHRAQRGKCAACGLAPTTPRKELVLTDFPFRMLVHKRCKRILVELDAGSIPAAWAATAAIVGRRLALAEP
jgi:hypothetical protein